MKHSDPAKRIQLINECLRLILEVGQVPNSAVKPKPIGLQSMMGTDWVSDVKPSDNKNKTSSPTIGAYDTSPEAENVRQITAVQQADRQLSTQLAGRQQTGNRMLDIGLNALSPDSRFQELLGGVAAAVGAKSSPRVTRGSANSRGTYSLSGTSINRDGTRRANTQTMRDIAVPTRSNRDIGVRGWDSIETTNPSNTGPRLSTWHDIVDAIKNNPKPGENFEITSPKESMQRAYNISRQEADLLTQRQRDAYNAISSPKAREIATSMHGNPNDPSYFEGETKVAVVDPTRNTMLDRGRGLYQPTSAGDSFSLVSASLPRTQRERTVQHEIGHNIADRTLSPDQFASSNIGTRTDDWHSEYRNRPSEVGARIRSSIVNYRRDMAKFKETLGDALSPLKRNVVDVLTKDPEVKPENRVTPEIMDILKKEYYPYFHVKKQEKNTQTRMA